MRPTIQESNLVGLFLETLLYGILLVSSGYCLRIVLFQTGRLVLKPRCEIRWWVVVVVVIMTTLSTLDLALNLRLNMKAFIWVGGNNDSVAAVFNDTTDWSNITRYMLYVLQVAIADSILVFRLYVVVFNRSCRLPVIISGAVLAAGSFTAVVVITVLSTARRLLGPTPTEIIEITCFACDVILNAAATAMLVHKLWKTRATSPDADKWTTLIRIIIESGLIYMISVLALLISEPFGTLGYCVGDATGQITAITSILIIIRTHNVFQTSAPTQAGGVSTARFSPRSNVISTTVSISTIQTGSEMHVDLAMNEAAQLHSHGEKTTEEV
ncbi:hypothetical protein NM688_g3874 [Phlebia brevispora]|uniref:Uncharacterized protein n=1 Tax=Phlebia brevispora TaxID=194682 RepID=A0ACC1T562_9APHY|nr:hypothetical protein NM688_g3874 [Phlebia brevispora]